MAQTDESRLRESVASASWKEKEREEILAECRCVVSHPAFSKSKRCVTLLQYIIDKTLAGDQDGLKERILGIEVFGRDSNYDTNADPIVRMTANEIRKRLALCYQERNHGGGVRIQLVPGSYSPHFEFEIVEGKEPDGTSAELEPANNYEELSTQDSQHRETDPVDDEGRGKHPRRLLLGLTALALLSLLVALWITQSSRNQSTQQLIWTPLLDGNNKVLICVDDSIEADASERANWADTISKIIASHKIPVTVPKDTQVPSMMFGDAQAAARVIGIIAAHHHKAYMRGISTLALPDLRQGPDVLIGAFSNPWFLVLLSGLRYHVMVDPSTQDEWIEDAQNPGRRQWVGSGKVPYANTSVDYALVTRVHSQDTGTWILAIGGLGLHGNDAGSELLTDPDLDKILPADLRDTQKNFQIVVKTTVIDGNTGPPQIVATYVW